MKRLKTLLRLWPTALAAVITIGIIHLLTALILPSLYESAGYWKLARTLPLHNFVILPQAKPGTQVLPYQMPDTRMAICRFDIQNGTLHLSAVLPDAGWTLSLYTDDGRGYYALPAAGRTRLTANLQVLPPGQRFIGILPQQISRETNSSVLVAPAGRGIAVLHAPIHGRTFASRIETDLKQATCRKQAF